VRNTIRTAEVFRVLDPDFLVLSKTPQAHDMLPRITLDVRELRQWLAVSLADVEHVSCLEPGQVFNRPLTFRRASSLNRLLRPFLRRCPPPDNRGKDGDASLAPPNVPAESPPSAKACDVRRPRPLARD